MKWRLILALSEKQRKFVESYLVTNNAKQSALNAGYPDNKNTSSLAWQLLKSPKILAELDSCRTKLRGTITKDAYIDRAMKSFESLDITEPNAPRFYDIAGKALGYIGASGQPQITNQTLNITNINHDASQADQWALARKLIGND